MSLLRWMGVNSPATNSQNLSDLTEKDEWWSNSGEKYFGMENFGNTCYANSVLQALYFCKPFRELLELSSNPHSIVINSFSKPLVSSPDSKAEPHASKIHLKSPNHPNLSPSRPEKLTNSHSASVSLSGGDWTKLISSSTRSTLLDQVNPGNTQHQSASTPTRRARSNSAQVENFGVSRSDSAPHITQSLKPGFNVPSASSSGESSAVPPSSVASSSNSTAKRNWGAADLDQGGFGSRKSISHENNLTPSPQPGSIAAEPDPTIYSTLRDLFRHISRQPKPVGAVAPQAFIATLKRNNELFRSTMHQDAHEFLNYLVNSVAEDVMAEQEKRMEEERKSPLLEPTPPALKAERPKPGEQGSTWVHRLFEGVLTNETKCLTCETVTQRDESFLDLSIDIDQNTSLTACLRQFSASEMLCHKNKFSCDRCCSLQEAEKRIRIKKLPNVLALHLKRFKYQEDLQRYTKLTYRVVFPFELRLFNTTDDIPNPDRLYELWAIVVHIGTGLHHGHYVTILKSDGKWLLFDDNVVSRVEEHDIQKYYGDTPGVGSGYVLFYQAADLNLTDLIEMPTYVDDENCEEEEIQPGLEFDSTLQPFNEYAKASLARFEDSQKNSTTPEDISVSPRTAAPISNPGASPVSINAQSSPFHNQTRNSISPKRTVVKNVSESEVSSETNHYPQLLNPWTEDHLGLPMPDSALWLKNQGNQQFPDSSSAVSKSSRDRAESHPDMSQNQNIASTERFPQDIQSANCSPKGKKESMFSATSITSNQSSNPLPAHDSLSKAVSPPTTNPSNSSASPPNLQRKFSAKFLKRNKSSNFQGVFKSPKSGNSDPLSSNEHPRNQLHGSVVTHTGQREQQDSTGDSQPSSSSAVGKKTFTESGNSRVSPLVNQRHSASLGIRAVSSSASNSKSWTQISSSHSQSNGVHRPQFLGGSHGALSQHQQIVLQQSLLTTRGAQAPPATSPLNEKQQREIKRATEKASKQAQKEMIKALKAKEKQEKSLAKIAKGKESGGEGTSLSVKNSLNFVERQSRGGSVGGGRVSLGSRSSVGRE
ncbi:expressed protein [Phakopsora pachyrhizi]|uniref:ubiquitinyl hydrolase 1 n=1 Tax=Phakopsora pachyrhizi TaxID=170000 RepID=A0AAV0AUI2_PHAPC|nr:expressed protein [Phakopsora pachyrhizi]